MCRRYGRDTPRIPSVSSSLFLSLRVACLSRLITYSTPPFVVTSVTSVAERYVKRTKWEVNDGKGTRKVTSIPGAVSRFYHSRLGCLLPRSLRPPFSSHYGSEKQRMGDGTRREKETRRSEQSRKMTSDETEGRSLVGSFHLYPRFSCPVGFLHHSPTPYVV